MAHDFRQLGAGEVAWKLWMLAPGTGSVWKNKLLSLRMSIAARKLLCCLLTVPAPCHCGSQKEMLMGATLASEWQGRPWAQ